jgi:dihydrofolate reductase
MNYVYIATSIDGYIAKPDGDISWLQDNHNPNNDDYGYAEFIKHIDALVMGRKTYEKVRTFGEWPYTKKVIVLSGKLTEVPLELTGKVEFFSGENKEVLEHCHKSGFKNLYIDGGKVIQSFLEHDKIDELIITRLPIILGDGVPLFSINSTSLKFKHKSTTVYDDALVKSHYVREREDK